MSAAAAHRATAAFSAALGVHLDTMPDAELLRFSRELRSEIGPAWSRDSGDVRTWAYARAMAERERRGLSPSPSSPSDA